MGILIRPDGSIVAETVDDAIAISRRLTQQKGAGGDRRPPPASTQDERWQSFYAGLNKNQRAVLARLKQGECATDTLRAATGLKTNNELSGVTAGLKKNVKRCSLDDGSVYVREVRGKGRKAQVIYSPGPLLASKEFSA